MLLQSMKYACGDTSMKYVETKIWKFEDIYDMGLHLYVCAYNQTNRRKKLSYSW